MESKLSLTGSSLHLDIKEEKWKLFIVVSTMEKRASLNARSFCSNFPLEIEVRKAMCEAHSDCTHAFRVHEQVRHEISG